MVGKTVKGIAEVVEVLNSAVFHAAAVRVQIQDGTLKSIVLLNDNAREILAILPGVFGGLEVTEAVSFGTLVPANSEEDSK